MRLETIVDRVKSDGYDQWRIIVDREHPLDDWSVGGWARNQCGTFTIEGGITEEGLELSYL